MDWFLYDNGLRHERVKNSDNLSPCQVIVNCQFAEDQSFKIFAIRGKILTGLQVSLPGLSFFTKLGKTLVIFNSS